MIPFYFGHADRRLFGIYQPPAQAGTGNRAAVLCYPLGEDYIYAHRAMRRLATALSLSGLHTLRFDFFGTGDSGGETADGDPTGWETDVDMALQELNDIAGTRHATLIGLRSGAAVAAQVARKRPNGIDALVLWDPVAHGDAYDGTGLRMLPQRTLLLITERLAWHARLLPSATSETSGFVDPEFIDDIWPWIEESASAGRLPMKVIQRILAWLR